MDWKFERQDDGSFKIIKYEEDHIADDVQLVKMLHSLILEKQRLETALDRINKKIKAVHEALLQIMDETTIQQRLEEAQNPKIEEDLTPQPVKQISK